MTMTTTQETNQIQLVTQASQLERDMLTVSSNWEYNAKDVAGYMVTADGKIITIKKPQIQTSFWFGESGYDFQEKVELASKASRDREYFKQKNIANSKLWTGAASSSCSRYVEISRFMMLHTTPTIPVLRVVLPGR